MREILFRGKRVSDGKWLYGMYSDERARDADFACISPLRGTDDETLDWAIIPQTLGQFTGVCDKDGERIFDGDILESRYDDKHPEEYCFEVVLWEDNGWHIKQFYDGVGEVNADVLGMAWKSFHTISDAAYDSDIMDDSCAIYSRIVGNIWDIKERIEEKC